MSNLSSLPLWTFGQACAWIMTRNSTDAASAMQGFFGDVETGDELETSERYRVARAELVAALVEGKITASAHMASDVRIEIPPLQWWDMQHEYTISADGLAYRPVTASGLAYAELLFMRQNVVTLWPEIPRPTTSTTRKRGPRPERRMEVESAMRAMADLDRLASMKEVEMEACFKANRETCRLARRAVLSEFGVK